MRSCHSDTRALDSTGVAVALFNLFSKRQKALRGEVSDVFQYENLPQPLRVQIGYIWRDVLGSTQQDGYYAYNADDVYRQIVEILRREYGVFCLPPAPRPFGNEEKELWDFFLNEKDVEKTLDVVELVFRSANHVARDYNYRNRADASASVSNAFEELNARFREHGVGYQFEDGCIVRTDSTLIHAEVVKPVLTVLRGKPYAGAQEEFLKAYEHYRHGNHKEALNECLKSLESLLKAICHKRKWSYPANATCSVLLKTCFDNELVPSFWQTHFSALRSCLESGVPTVRNKMGGHGQGTEVVDVPRHIVGYALHTTAASLLMLAECEKAL